MQKFYQLFILSINSLGEYGVDKIVYNSEDFAFKKGQQIYDNNTNVKGYVIVEVKDDNRRLVYQAVENQFVDQFDYNDARVTVAN